MLFRPSLPWGFAAGSGSIFGVAACHWSSRSRISSSSRKQEEKVATIIFGSGSILGVAACHRSSQEQQQQETGGKGSYNNFFLQVSEE